MGQIFAFCQSDGKLPVLSDYVKMTCKIGEISVISSYKLIIIAT